MTAIQTSYGINLAALGLAEPSTAWRVELPMPPALSALFNNVSLRGKVESKPYKEWKTVARMRLLGQRTMEGPLDIHIAIRPGKGWRRNSDIANREKAVVDSLVQNGIIEDDNCLIVRKLTLEYQPIVDVNKERKPYVVVTIMPYREESNAKDGSVPAPLGAGE